MAFINHFYWRWPRRLPSPFSTADLRAGYGYELAFRQFEVSDTRVFDRPAAGRSFFEQLIRDHLDVGRPESVSLIFDRRIIRTTPGSWRTKVITQGVDPQISCYYKSSRIKQYFKEQRALRTETVICNTRDFGIGRRVTAENWKALRAVGDAANQRLSDAQAADARPAPDVATFTQVTRPSQIDGQHVPALPFGDPRVMAVLAAHRHIPPGVPENGQTESAAAAITLGRTLRRLSALPLNTKSIPERGWPGPGVAVSVGDGSSGNTVTTSVDLCSNDISVLRGVGKHMPEPICG
jgi:hypothetical protein